MCVGGSPSSLDAPVQYGKDYGKSDSIFLTYTHNIPLHVLSDQKIISRTWQVLYEVEGWKPEGSCTDLV